MNWLLRFLTRIGAIEITESRESDEDWSCKRKIRYGHEQTAMRAAEEQAHARQLGRYKCRYCDGWHLYSLHKEDE